MFLSHVTIERYIAEKIIIIGPEYNSKHLRPIGLRMHLGKYLLIAEPDRIVDLTDNRIVLQYKKVDLEQEEFYLKSGQFVLGSTYETIQTMSNLMVMLDGRSTVARLGLTTHVTASVIDGAYEKPQAITLEIKNVGNFTIRLKYKDPIAMLLFTELKDPITQTLQSQYAGCLEHVMPPNLQFKTGQDR